MNFAPRTLRITENHPEAVNHVHVSVKSQDNLILYTEGDYPLSGTITDIPIGSNGLFDAAPPVDTFMNIFVKQIANEGHGPDGPEQQVPGGPFQLAALVDSSEGLEVIV